MRDDEQRAAVTALILSTTAFTLCFAAWVVNAVLVTSLVSSGTLAFTRSQVGWLLAAPILTGAIARIPLGILTDRFGGRVIFPGVMVVAAASLFAVSAASSYGGFLLASLGFGIAGGSFAVGVGHVSRWFDRARQGTALGIFGMGNTGAAITAIVAPLALQVLTSDGSEPEGWRQLPRIYAALLLILSVVFFLMTRDRPRPDIPGLAPQLAPLRSLLVWRLGLYYFLVFGSFVALAQWIVLYGVNVHGMTLTQAGWLAAAFCVPSGLIRGAGGWLADRLGARTVMYWVFGSCVLSGLILSIPPMHITSPGAGIHARTAGTVESVSPSVIRIGEAEHALTPPPESPPDGHGNLLLPEVSHWHELQVAAGDVVEQNQLLAREVSHIHYPAHLWLFAALVFVFGMATGIGQAGVYRFIPDHFPTAVGTVGGLVGFLGALGGFVFPLVFASLLETTGLWSSCWLVLTGVSLACLIWMHLVVRRIMVEEVPDLARLMERRPGRPLLHTIRLVDADAQEAQASTVEDLLQRIGFFSGLGSEETKEVAAIGRHDSWPGSTRIFDEGDPGDCLYIIIDGAVKIRRRDPDGTELDLATLTEGDFFGELALIDGEPRSAAAITDRPCELFRIERRDFLRLLSDAPRVLAGVLVGLTGKVRDSNQKYLEERGRLDA